MTRASLFSTVAMAGAVLCAPAQGAKTTSTFQVRLVIQAQCLAATGADLNFGIAGALQNNLDATSTIQVQCSATTPYNISFNQGVNASTVTGRQMRGSSSNLVGYGLYSDASRTSNWGNTVGSDTIAGTATGAPQKYTVYGRVPAQPTPAPDNYTDVITVTITY